MKTISARQILIALAILATITVNILANALPINGQNTGAVSDQFDVLFVPAGYVFSIWGIIYLFLIGFTVYQLLPAQRENARLVRITPWVLLASAANIAWIFLWHYNLFNLTVPVMLILLGSLIAIYLSLNIGKNKVSQQERWLVNATFSIYLGWITIATVANISQWLYFINWNGFGISASVWTVIMLAVATLISAGMAFLRRDWLYLLVPIWAVIGIALKQAANPLVSTGAWVSVGVLALLFLYALLKQKPIRA